ncbi:hypothetical protein NDU88_006836 [Pleurodeles waltl]|uniref:Uncharacterized protein n=1 Tax=Pleurodeles waltl TaxID=8319 RepID=A0AAV7WEP9_PLEWA|nr:hypothetical protein NDU88_006836 [Pleurodeles waltl]
MGSPGGACAVVASEIVVVRRGHREAHARWIARRALAGTGGDARRSAAGGIARERSGKHPRAAAGSRAHLPAAGRM